MSEFEGVVTPEAARYIASGVSALLRSSDGDQDAPEIAADQPRRGFNGRRSDESPSMRAKRLRIESGEQEAPSHVVAEVRFGRERYITCICGFRGTGTSDKAMADGFDRHVK